MESVKPLFRRICQYTLNWNMPATPPRIEERMGTRIPFGREADGDQQIMVTGQRSARVPLR